MRALLITLTSVFYAAAAIVAAAALMIPAAPPPSASPVDTPLTEESLGRLARERETDRKLVADLKDTITGLQSERTEDRESEALEELAREREADRKLVADLQDNITELQSELAGDRKSEALEELTREQAASRKLIADMKDTITALQEETREGTSAVTPAARSREAPRPGTTARSTWDIPGDAGYADGSSRGEAAGRVIALIGGGLFESGQVALNDDLNTAVEKIVPIIALNPEHRISVEGHTDNRPVGKSMTEKYDDNGALSLLRAGIVARLIEEQGVPAERIVVVGYGATRPLAPNTTVEGRAENRRVEVRLIPPAGERSE